MAIRAFGRRQIVLRIQMTFFSLPDLEARLAALQGDLSAYERDAAALKNEASEGRFDIEAYSQQRITHGALILRADSLEREIAKILKALEDSSNGFSL